MREEVPDADEGREPADDTVDREADAAAAEAGAIGGRGGAEGVDEAERPLAESGEGVSEGFEQAEQGLVENASHDIGKGDPLRDAGEAEEPHEEPVHGSADEIDSTEDDREP